MLPGLFIRSSSIHAAGCYTMRPIRKGERICEYDGPRLTKEAADVLYQDRFVTYLFGYGDRNMVIDGFGTGMFVNHSCAPNCETIDDEGHIYVEAIRNIAAGEELLYEYNLYDSDDATQDCYCGSPNCRGTMFSDLELKRRKKLAKAAAKKVAK
jgi:SET domain-containing protein